MNDRTDRWHRLLLGGLVVVLVGVLVTVVVTGRGVRDRQVEAATTGLRGHADVAALALDDRHAAVSTLAELWARDPRLREAVEVADQDELERLLVDLEGASRYVGGAFLTDPSGRMIATTPEDVDLIGGDFSDRDWFRGALQTGEPYVAEMVRSRTAGNPLAMGIGVTVVDDDGTMIGVLATLSLVDEVQQFAGDVLRDVGASVTVVDRRGHLVARTGQSPSAVERFDDPRVVRDGSPVAAPVVGFDDGVFWAVAPLDRSGGAVLLTRPEADLLGAADRGRLRTLIGMAVLAGLALTVAVALMRNDQRRHEALHHVAERDAFLTGLLAAVDVGVAVTDGEGRTIYANDAHRRTPPHPGPLRRVLAGEQTASATRRIQDPTTGQARWVQVDARALRDDSMGLVGVVQVSTDVTVAREREALLERSAETDPLTGLINRAGLWRRAGAILDADGPSGPALLYLDLDGFKAVNDRDGHATGDELLVEVSRALLAVTRDEDVVARLGGDEFVVLLRAVGDDALAPFARRVRDAVAATPLAAAHGVTASVGWAVPGVDGDALDTLLGAADSRMYRAKTARTGVV